MLILHTVESVFAEETFVARQRLAATLRVPLSWVTVEWPIDKEGDRITGTHPVIKVADPEVAVLTEDQQALLPSLTATLGLNGVQHPEEAVATAGRWLTQQVRLRMQAFA